MKAVVGLKKRPSFIPDDDFELTDDLTGDLTVSFSDDLLAYSDAEKKSIKLQKEEAIIECIALCSGCTENSEISEAKKPLNAVERALDHAIIEYINEKERFNRPSFSLPAQQTWKNKYFRKLAANICGLMDAIILLREQNTGDK